MGEEVSTTRLCVTRTLTLVSTVCPSWVDVVCTVVRWTVCPSSACVVCTVTSVVVVVLVRARPLVDFASFLEYTLVPFLFLACSFMRSSSALRSSRSAACLSVGCLTRPERLDTASSFAFSSSPRRADSMPAIFIRLLRQLFQRNRSAEHLAAGLVSLSGRSPSPVVFPVARAGLASPFFRRARARCLRDVKRGGVIWIKCWWHGGGCLYMMVNTTLYIKTLQLAQSYIGCHRPLPLTVLKRILTPGP